VGVIFVLITMRRFSGFTALLVGIILNIQFKLSAQNLEVGALAGLSHYYGDVSNEFHVENIRYAGYIFVRKHVSQRVVLRGNLGYIRIVGIDSISSSIYQQRRNLNFYTDIIELSSQVEYNLVDDKTRGRRIKNYTIPYVFAGIGGIYFTPYTIFNNNTYNLAAVGASGTSYSQLALVIPVGAGVRYYLTPNWQVGFEFGIRFTSTSDLDDIRGESLWPDPASLPTNDARYLLNRSNVSLDPGGYKYKPGYKRGKIEYITDTYVAYGLTVSYKLGLVKGMRFKGKAVHCPRFY